MKTCFVIVNYNDYASTSHLINNIKNYKLIDEIVVVDNNSNDESLIQLNNLRIKKLTVLSSHKNGGYSYALNIGCKYLIKKYKECNIFISNSDVVINNEDDLDEMLDYLVRDNVIVGPRINTHGEISRGWRIPNTFQETLFNIPLVQKLVFKSYKYDNDHYIADACVVDTVSGCFFLIDSNHLKKIGFFDENVFLYYEENIFGVKTRNLKKKILVVNNVEVIHNHSVTIDKSMDRMGKIDIQKNSQYYYCSMILKSSKLSLFFLRVSIGIGKFLLKLRYLFK